MFEFPTKGGSESCHFCNQRVYVVERMTTEGKYFHRNCFRCEYCNTSLRLGKSPNCLVIMSHLPTKTARINNNNMTYLFEPGNYVFDREGRYGERFYCAPHYTTIRLYGWKKYDQLIKPESEKFSSNCRSSYLTPASHQVSRLFQSYNLDETQSVDIKSNSSAYHFLALFKNLILFVLVSLTVLLSLLVSPLEIREFILENILCNTD